MRELVTDLEAKLALANRYLEAAFDKEKEQQELMLQLQIQLDTLMQQRANSQQDESGNRATGGVDHFKKQNNQFFTVNPINQQDNFSSKNELIDNKCRAKTAPNAAGTLLTASQKMSESVNGGVKKQRTVNSSPALFTLDRVMQSFRARSQILAETLEESDNVMQNKHFNSTFDISTDVLNEFDETEYNRNCPADDAEEATFSRKGTFKVNRAETKNGLNTTKRANNSPKELDVTSLETQKKLRDLAINIKLVHT